MIPDAEGDHAVIVMPKEHHQQALLVAALRRLLARYERRGRAVRLLPPDQCRWYSASAEAVRAWIAELTSVPSSVAS